jgi:hypothetical protein
LASRISRVTPFAFSRLATQARWTSSGDYPTIPDANRMPRNYRELTNESIAILALEGIDEATKERLVREVMRVDNISWPEATLKVQEMDAINDSKAWVMHLPHMMGVFLGVVGAIVSIPMTFHKPTAVWFNANYAKHDLPDGGLEGIETIFEVGGWSWGWMEPVMGTLSFALLGLQFARANMQNMKIKPYTEFVESWRANRLAKMYPQYEREIVRAFSKTDSWILPRDIQHQKK